MARTGARRARELDSSDEDDQSRPSTPISTAPNDSKRVRRSRIPNDDGSGIDDEERVPSNNGTRVSSIRTPNNAGVSSISRPRHQPGAIVRVKLTNFVTYTSAEFHPGPNLNMVIGPNGTGKSTLVCAICLGLGWGTQYLGRAKDVAEFVKHGCREATIEIELQRSPDKVSEPNPVITRTIKREGNKSSYTLNGRATSRKAVMTLAQGFDIQIDNLCQFLPQDKVVEFAQMTPIEILESTQKAAASAEMLTMHEQLKSLRADQKSRMNDNKADRESLANLQNRQEMQKTEVERLKERMEIQKRLGDLEHCRPIPEYSEAKRKVLDAKNKVKALEHELAKLKHKVRPTLERVNAKQVYKNLLGEARRTKEKELKNVEKECERLERVINLHEESMKDCDNVEAAEKKSVAPLRNEINRQKLLLRDLQAQKEQPPEQYDNEALQAHITERMELLREANRELDGLSDAARDLHEQLVRRKTRTLQIRKELKALDTQSGQQEAKLKEMSRDTFRIWTWVKENRQTFTKHVYGPPMIECSVKQPDRANQVESVLQKNDYKIITVQCKEDFKILQEELVKQKLHDVSIRTCSDETLDRYKAPLDRAVMERCGVDGWAIDLLDGPATVLGMLCQEKFLHQAATAREDVDDEQFKALLASPVKSFVTRSAAFTITRRAEYGPGATSTKRNNLRPATIWSSQTADMSAKIQLKEEVQQCRGEHDLIDAELTEVKNKAESLQEKRDAVTEELRKMREERDAKQQALTVYNGLDIKIAEAQSKIQKAQQTIDSTKDRLAENRRKKDEAMFEKGRTVLQYVNGVHELHLKHEVLLETEILLVEAKSDFETLSARNQHLVDSIEGRETEIAEARAVSQQAQQQGKALVQDFKTLKSLADERANQGDKSLLNLINEMVEKREMTVADLGNLIDIERAKLELNAPGDANVIKEYEERARKIEMLRRKLTQFSNAQDDFAHAIKEIRQAWEPRLDTLVARISDAFGDSFARIGCAGQVVVYKASSDDPADCTDSSGGAENGLDFEHWAIHIRVKFRENEPLSLLDSHRQSGGERAVSTIFYLMALQSLSRAPFRVVDEINQGMDPRNERMVHGRMVDIAAPDADGDPQGSQYFLITPKLLSGLKYKSGMTVLCIVSGENMPSATEQRKRDENGLSYVQQGQKIDFRIFAQKARELSLDTGNRGRRVDSGVSMRTSVPQEVAA